MESLASTEIIHRWRSVPTTIAADVDQGQCLLDGAIRPLRGARVPVRLFGRAVTARCDPPDISPVLKAVALLNAGDVLVIAASGDAKTAMIGDILGGYARSRGCVGVICDGAVRDAGELATWQDFPVFCRSVIPRGPRIGQAGDVNVPVNISGRIVYPGDLLIGDDDGLVAFRPDRAAELIDAAEHKMATERTWREALARGTDLLSLFGLSAGRSE